MSKDYVIREEEGGIKWATLTEGDYYIEVPHRGDEEDVQATIATMLQEIAEELEMSEL